MARQQLTLGVFQIDEAGADLVTATDGLATGHLGQHLQAGRQAFAEVVDFMVQRAKADPNAAFAGSVPYLMLAGNLMAGWQLARALLVAEQRQAEGTDTAFMAAKITTARFYADHILSKLPGVRDSIVQGSAGVTDMALEAF